MARSKRRSPVRLELGLTDGGCLIRVPAADSYAAESDKMTVVVYGQKQNKNGSLGAFVHVEVVVSRWQILNLAHAMHNIIDLEEAKARKLRARMRREV